MTQSQNQELVALNRRFATVGLTGPELTRRANLEARRISELSAHRGQLAAWAERFKTKTA